MCIYDWLRPRGTQRGEGKKNCPFGCPLLVDDKQAPQNRLTVSTEHDAGDTHDFLDSKAPMAMEFI